VKLFQLEIQHDDVTGSTGRTEHVHVNSHKKSFTSLFIGSILVISYLKYFIIFIIAVFSIYFLSSINNFFKNHIFNSKNFSLLNVSLFS
jgi:hypothetical protein